MCLLGNALLDQAPDGLAVDRGMTSGIDRKSRPEPDVLVFRAEGQVYVPTGIHRERLQLKEPFPIEIDLTAINRRRSVRS
ncbi:hypothetical protein DVH02_12950 [Streptomyces corynorhini]|uniref:Uncharacterized protein n=2 Tax=Streptomyces corynorhini TaxID=2282652 RepID=A0A370BAS8_9ACTN|nr:hypothetical protein DVH02_12950 [Streptomyces corynorhini]